MLSCMLSCSTLTAAQQSLPCLRKRAQVFSKPLVMAASSDQTRSAAGTRLQAVNNVNNTARYTAEIDLGPETVVQMEGLLPTENPLKLTLIYPVKGFKS